jgi:hypothetical protein
LPDERDEGGHRDWTSDSDRVPVALRHLAILQLMPEKALDTVRRCPLRHYSTASTMRSEVERQAEKEQQLWSALSDRRPNVQHLSRFDTAVSGLSWCCKSITHLDLIFLPGDASKLRTAAVELRQLRSLVLYVTNRSKAPTLDQCDYMLPLLLSSSRCSR